ncbi:hypothetical protein E1B28_013402 [Marasmius oreades]|uniref:Uncharacterized protein n=1 Tax=Marasmius oreades TaxID=181124 RepID=A0A9P7UNZ7_9AGAR|nr:uncharacterized protein E1B28_013402 [Marasmius oreades]KAG7087436.1 hypothetical protein E1B28_013402 [Marasmius oreades]
MSQSSKSPRPILKRTHSDERRHSPPYPHGVRFPPSPALARTFDAYSSSTYDRSPIEVSRNTCALPERGCPGRTYDIDDPSFSKSVKKTVTSRGAHAHPRLLHSTSSPSYYSESISNPSSSSLPPPLILDLSSESEESDGFIGPPPPTSFSRRSSISPSSRIDRYPSSCTYHPEMMSSSPSEIKVRIRRSSRERGERIRSSPILERQDIDDPGYEDRLEFSSHCSPPSPNTRSKKHRTRKSISALTQSMSTFNMQDDAGCLGGF